MSKIDCIELNIVSSKDIELLQYFPEDEVLEVFFKNESVYRYFEVPFPVIQSFIDAHNQGYSIGQHFNLIVKGLYRYEKIMELIKTNGQTK